MGSSERHSLVDALSALPPKSKVPASNRVLNTWISQAERHLDSHGGRLGWLIASTLVSGALQQALDERGKPLFLIKGGTLLQHRIPGTTRSTTDLDGLVRGDLEEFLERVDEVLESPWGPCTFTRGPIVTINVPRRVVKPRRFDITVQLVGQTWRRIRVEVSSDEGSAGKYPEMIRPPSLTGFGLPTPDQLFGLAMSYQVAQKVHAVTEPHDPPTYINDRARDVVDLLLINELVETTGSIPLKEIHAAIIDVFGTRAKDAEATGNNPRGWPTRITAYTHWESDFAAAAASVGLKIELHAAVQRVNLWLEEIMLA